MLSGRFIDWNTGGGEQCRAILTVTESTAGVQHAGFTHPMGREMEGERERERVSESTRRTAVITYNFTVHNQ